MNLFSAVYTFYVDAASQAIKKSPFDDHFLNNKVFEF